MKPALSLCLTVAAAILVSCSHPATDPGPKTSPTTPRTEAEQQRLQLESTSEPLPAGLMPRDVAIPYDSPTTIGHAPPPGVIEFIDAYLKSRIGADMLGQWPVSITASAIETGPSNRQLVFAFVGGRPYCGTGGCWLLVLEAQGATWSVRSDLGVVHLPVRVLETESHGLPDIGVTVAGGGIMVPYEITIAFDGTHYSGPDWDRPNNPAIHPHRLPPGSVVLSHAMPSIEIPALPPR